MLGTENPSRRAALRDDKPNCVINSTERKRYLEPDTKISDFRNNNVKFVNLTRDHFTLLQDLKETNFLGAGWAKSRDAKYGDHYAHFLSQDGEDHAVIVTVLKKSDGVLTQWTHADFDQARESMRLMARNDLQDDVPTNLVYVITTASGSQSNSLSFDTGLMGGLAGALGAVILMTMAKIIKEAMNVAEALEASAYESFEETSVLALVEVTAAQAMTMGFCVLAIAGLLLLYFLQKQIALNFTIGNFSKKRIEIKDHYVYNVDAQLPEQQPYLAPPHTKVVNGMPFMEYDGIGVTVHNSSEYKGIGVAFVLYDKVANDFCSVVMRIDYIGKKVINMLPGGPSSAAEAFEFMPDGGMRESIRWNDLTVSLTVSEKENSLCSGTFTIEDSSSVS
ncbi:hypothetical protein [Pseudoduganella violacea]|uniref:Uncharacterized protein n=1 Tax=Pseudoduganella violacea TaxID=1715466 RepID=A0A7W5BGE5_9BURK|nr:hypothetical protein [Pseudoduganella violacea]MBB3122426.1 hypothetical protein [Pseudoduganella violacea]